MASAQVLIFTGLRLTYLRLGVRLYTVQLLLWFSSVLSQSGPILSSTSESHICLQPHYRKKLKPCRKARSLWLLLQPLVNEVCNYLITPRLPTPSLGRWTEQVDQDLRPLQQQLQKILQAETKQTDTCPAWKAFEDWLMAVTMETEVFELRALVGIIQERMWDDKVQREGVLGEMQLLGQVGPQLPFQGPLALLAWKQSGLVEEAQRFFQKMLNTKERGVYPLRFFYSTEDFRRVTFSPWPALPKLEWPDPKDVFPQGVGADLERHWQEIAQEARSLSQRLADAPDAYPPLTGHGQWTRQVLYDLSGWNEELCSHMQRLCGMLKGKMRTEDPNMLQWKEKNILMTGDEVVTLFRVRGPGYAWLHFGQDFRVNVHLCLMGCNGSSITVAGEQRFYHDGSFFAFEDRADHEIQNTAHEDRINLVVGVLHPGSPVLAALSPQSSRLTPSDRLRFISSIIEESPASLPGQYLGDGLLLSAFYGYADVMVRLLQAGAPINHRDALGMAAIHVAIRREHVEIVKILCEFGADIEAEDSEGFMPLHVAVGGNMLSAVSLLVAHHADIGARGPHGSPVEVLQITGRSDLAAWLRDLPRLLQSERRGKTEL